MKRVKRGLDINLCALEVNTYPTWQHLPAEEIEEIKDLISAMRKNVGRLGVLKRMAFGQNKGSLNRASIQKIIGKDKTAELLELFGAFHSATEAHKVVAQDWGFVDVSFTMVNKFRNANLDKIYEKQEEFKRDFGHLRLTHKRSRLEELSYLYEYRKSIFDTTGSREDEKMLKQTIEQIKREVEGDKIIIDGKIELDIKQTLNIHTQKEIMGRLNLLTIVVSRISAKVNVNPIWMMTKLTNSYYSKFSGMQKPDNDIMTDEVMFPNNMVYNFDDIKNMHENMKMKQAPLKKLSIDITPKQEKKALTAKEKLLAMLEKKKESLKEAQSSSIKSTDPKKTEVVGKSKPKKITVKRSKPKK